MMHPDAPPATLSSIEALNRLHSLASQREDTSD
jgi:hypothetical protein